jgi:hypothetical protein
VSVIRIGDTWQDHAMSFCPRTLFPALFAPT